MKNEVIVTINPKFKALRQPCRNKIMYGGRGGGKSHAIAQTLLVMGREKQLRILCTREIQTSIRDSVHKLLSDLINKYGFKDYDIQRETIKNSITGTEFLFKGLYRNISQIKSTEAIDICWVEEAQSVSNESWIELIPTIRKPNSEIWASFNRFMEDPVFDIFIKNKRPETIELKVNYYDNPFCPDVLKKEAEHLKLTNYPLYLHVWEGEPLSSNPFGLWKLEYIQYRESTPTMKRIVIAIDPAVSVTKDSDETGIIVAGKGIDNNFYILEDLSGKYSPNEWAHIVDNAYHRWHADKIIAEKNQGGDLVESNLRVANANLPIKLIQATKGKFLRAEPVANLYEQRKVFHVKKFFELEKQMLLFNNMIDRRNDMSPDRCLVGDTLVTTKKGYKKISEITNNDFVLTRRGYKKVLKQELTQIEVQVYKVIFNDGSFLIGTGNHPIVMNQDIKTIDSLVYGDNIIKEDIYKWKLRLLFLKVLNMLENLTQKINTSQDTFGVIEMELQPRYTEIFTKRCSELSQKGLWYIIKIITFLITILVIWSWLIIKNILNITNKSLQKNKKNTLQKSDIKQKNGMQVKLGIFGINNTVKNVLSKGLDLLGKYAKYVAKSFCLILIDQKCVVENAMQKIEEIVVKITLKKNVQYVKKLLFQINIIKRKHVHVVAVEKLLKKRDVYNILIQDNHEYFANGCLVHNCDALAYSLTELGLGKDYASIYEKMTGV